MKASERSGTRVVVADRGEARFYDVGTASTLQIAGRLVDPIARLHDRDLVSDRPGRVFNRAPPATGRRGAGARHATDGERSPRKHEATLFARRIGAELERARRQGRFEKLVLIAGPPFLGELRSSLPKSLRAMTVAEVAKDLVHRPERVLRTYVTTALEEARFTQQGTS
jgi:protein required for attachment to host cells